jgi:alcohol dehydrogenase
VTSARYALWRAPRNVLFGRGTLAMTGPICSKLGRTVFVCIDPFLPEWVESELRGSFLDAGVEATFFSDMLASGTPELAARAVAAAHAAAPDAVVAVGGGTVLDLGKHVCLLLNWPGPLSLYYGEGRVPGPCLPLVAVPATAGTGSEVSPVAVVSDPEQPMKAVISSDWNVPIAAICDPLLTVSCPPTVTAHAGMDALVNAIESLLAVTRTSDPGALLSQIFVGNSSLTRGHALEGVRLIGGSLVRAVANGKDLEARESMLLGTLHGALAYSQSGTSLIHALSYPVEGLAHVPHGLSVGLLLPYALAWNRDLMLADLAEVATSLGLSNTDAAPVEAAIAVIAWTAELGRRVGIPGSLQEIGIKRADLPELARQAAGITRLLLNNPGPADAASLELVLEAAWAGDVSRLSGVAGTTAAPVGAER